MEVPFKKPLAGQFVEFCSRLRNRPHRGIARAPRPEWDRALQREGEILIGMVGTACNANGRSARVP